MKQYRNIKTKDAHADFGDGKYGASSQIEIKETYRVCNLCQKEMNDSLFWFNNSIRDIDICPACQTLEEKSAVFETVGIKAKKYFESAVEISREYRVGIDRIKRMIKDINNIDYPFKKSTWPEKNKKVIALNLLNKALMELEGINNPPF